MHQESDAQQVTKRYIRLAIGIIIIVLIVILWRAMIRLNYKLALLRSNFWPTIKLIIISISILTIAVLILITTLNFYAREKINQEDKDKLTKN